MKRVLAVIAAAAMIAGAVLLRSRLGSDGPSPEAARLRIGCAVVVAEPCREWATKAGFDVVVLADPPPATGYGAAVGALDAVVAPEPFGAQALALPGPAAAVATSLVVLVTRADDQGRLRGPGSAWSDAIDDGQRLWIEPDGSWFAPVVRAGLVAAALTADAQTNGTSPPALAELAAQDLRTDAVLAAGDDLAAATSAASSPDARDAISAMAARELDIVATVAAAAGKRSSQKVTTPEPEVAVTITLTPRADLAERGRLDATAAALTAALQAAGWAAPGGAGSGVAEELLIGIAAELRS